MKQHQAQNLSRMGKMIPDSFKLIFETIIGSNLYGTNTEESDVDIRGVFIPSEEYFYSFLNKFMLAFANSFASAIIRTFSARFLSFLALAIFARPITESCLLFISLPLYMSNPSI